MAMNYPSNWPEISFQAKQAKNWTCQTCGAVQGDDPRNPITVHHIDYNPFNCESNNLKVLCARCHLRLQIKEKTAFNNARKAYLHHLAGHRPLPGFGKQLNIALPVHPAKGVESGTGT